MPDNCSVLHLRILCPDHRTDAVVDTLCAEPGVAGVVLVRGAGVAPVADLVQADVAREAADDLLTRLKDLGLYADGAISLQTVDFALGAAPERAKRDAPGEESDAVVWEQLSAATGEESTRGWSFLLFLTIATLIAAVGLLIDSQVLIVGAMVLGPEFGPLAGIAVAAVQFDRHKMWLSSRVLLVGFPVAIAATAVAVALLNVAGQIPEGYLTGERPMTSFVARPDVFSVIVAMLAGIAGTLSLTASKSSTLVGVFISVTTVPAAAEIGATLVTGQRSAALGATAQLAVNLLCIVLAAVGTLHVQRAVWAAIARRQHER